MKAKYYVDYRGRLVKSKDLFDNQMYRLQLYQTVLIIAGIVVALFSLINVLEPRFFY